MGGLAFFLSAFLAIIALFYLVILFISLVVGTFTAIVNWILLKKAGESGWKCLIPVYGAYVFFDLAWSPGAFWRYMLAYLGANISLAVLQFGIVQAIIPTIIFAIWLIIIKLRYSLKLAQSFGYKKIFGLGLFFVPIVFNAIMAFDRRNKYVGPIF